MDTKKEKENTTPVSSELAAVALFFCLKQSLVYRILLQKLFSLWQKKSSTHTNALLEQS